MDPELNAMTPDEALLRRCKELTKDFRAEHPAKAAASDFVDACQRPASEETSFAAERAAAMLHVRYVNLCELFEFADINLEECIFKPLLQIMQASYDLGMHAAPDGRKARLARHDRAGSDFTKLVSTLLIYLESHPELVPKASEKFANIIRPDILELFGKDADAPSIYALVTALRAVRKKSLVL